MRKIKTYSKWVFLLIGLAFCSGEVLGQDLSDDFKVFSGLTLNYKLNKVSRISASAMGIYDPNISELSYYQYGLKYRHRVGANSYLSAKFDLVQISERDTNSYKGYKRIGLQYMHRARFKRFPMTNSIVAELFLPGFSKYQARFFYEGNLEWKIKKMPWRLRPFTKFKLYYYSGGRYTKYYNEKNELVAFKSPNDFHRWRWFWGLKFQPAKSLNVSLSYFWNEEFNARLNNNSDINIYNKDQTGIVLPFNSYGGVNVAISYTIRNKKKSTKTKK